METLVTVEAVEAMVGMVAAWVEMVAVGWATAGAVRLGAVVWPRRKSLYRCAIPVPESFMK